MGSLEQNEAQACEQSGLKLRTIKISVSLQVIKAKSHEHLLMVH